MWRCMVGDRLRRREFNSEFSSRREWSGETVELSYKGVEMGIALLEAFELALV
jgi:hypothetical protein